MFLMTHAKGIFAGVLPANEIAWFGEFLNNIGQGKCRQKRPQNYFEFRIAKIKPTLWLIVT